MTIPFRTNPGLIRLTLPGPAPAEPPTSGQVTMPTARIPARIADANATRAHAGRRSLLLPTGGHGYDGHDAGSKIRGNVHLEQGCRGLSTLWYVVSPANAQCSLGLACHPSGLRLRQQWTIRSFLPYGTPGACHASVDIPSPAPSNRTLRVTISPTMPWLLASRLCHLHSGE